MRKRAAVCCAVILGALAFSCRPSFIKYCEDDGRAEKWNQKQIDDVCQSAAYRYRLLREEKGVLYVRYNMLSWKDLRKQTDDSLQKLDDILNPVSEDSRKFIDTFNQRAYLEHLEKVAKLRRRAFRTAEIYNTFRQYMGQSENRDDYGSSDDSEYGGERDHNDKYDIKKIALPDKLTETFPFTSDQIEEAKKRGALEKIEDHLWWDTRKLDRKQPDPNNPDDQNAFRWLPKQEGVNFVSYKIQTPGKPQNNIGNYAEGFCVRVVNGKIEQKANPALKIFFPREGGMAVVVISSFCGKKDAESGLPDYVEQMVIANMEDVTKGGSGGDVLTKMFPQDEEKSRVVPPRPEIHVEIAHVGEEVNVWEKALTSAGWPAPSGYKNRMGSNYNIRIKFKKPEHDHESGETQSEFREIEWIVKEYTGGDRYTPSQGRVWEYYRPKGQFAGKAQAEVLEMENTKKVRFTTEDGEEKDILLLGKSTAIENVPYAIAYDEGEKRWRIEKDSGSKVFNKRKEIAEPILSTGEYGREESNESDHDMEMKPVRAADKKN